MDCSIRLSHRSVWVGRNRLPIISETERERESAVHCTYTLMYSTVQYTAQRQERYSHYHRKMEQRHYQFYLLLEIKETVFLFVNLPDFWNVTPCSFVLWYQRLEAKYCLHLLFRSAMIYWSPHPVIVLLRDLSECHFARHKSHIHWPGIEPLSWW